DGNRGVPREIRGGRDAKRSRRAAGARDLRHGRGVRGLRLPEIALRRLRAARVPVGVAPAPLSGGVSVRAPERAADGLLSTGVVGAGRSATMRGGAPA